MCSELVTHKQVWEQNADCVNELLRVEYKFKVI